MHLTIPLTMPKSQEPPATEFAKRLIAARKARNLTQVQLAERLGSTQRNISYYETGAGYPPAPVIVELADILEVSADELLGIDKAPKGRTEEGRDDPQVRRFWKKFQQIARLPEKDQRAVIRLVNSLAKAS